MLSGLCVRNTNPKDDARIRPEIFDIFDIYGTRRRLARTVATPLTTDRRTIAPECWSAAAIQSRRRAGSTRSASRYSLSEPSSAGRLDASDSLARTAGFRQWQRPAFSAITIRRLEKRSRRCNRALCQVLWQRCHRNWIADRGRKPRQNLPLSATFSIDTSPIDCPWVRVPALRAGMVLERLESSAGVKGGVLMAA